MMRKATLVVLLPVVALLCAWFGLRSAWQHGVRVEAPTLVEIERGWHLAAVSDELERVGVLRHRWLFSLYARWRGDDARLKSGEYRLEPGIDMTALLEQLVRGDVVRYRVTLPEGITLSAALDILRRAPALLTTLASAQDPRLLALAPDVPNVEGLFLPETYSYVRGDSDLSVLERAHGAQRRLLDALWPSRAAGLPVASPYEAVILASVVERETSVAEERRRIAGVFVRRLKSGMRLQADPTIIYGLGEDFSGNLTRAHLRDAGNLWNTYRHDGLPPTPIALPGSAAIAAVLDPAVGDSLYFVARGDGTHEFNATLEAHNEAVRRFQLRRDDSYRSTR